MAFFRFGLALAWLILAYFRKEKYLFSLPSYLTPLPFILEYKRNERLLGLPPTTSLPVSPSIIILFFKDKEDQSIQGKTFPEA